MDEVRFAAGIQYCEWVLACFYLCQERKQFGLITATSITNNMKEHAKDFALCKRFGLFARFYDRSEVCMRDHKEMSIHP
jgi:hypothetical protein